ncbi:hypothetical protein J2X36_002317 [Methylobacterium sp. BE186]|uniref:DUF1902 domain-containing protein n=1 Tax=Methylobacterium sp. BE186 TaxID=2817715 RepID=UPI0028618F80|nr:DUF1902 domain-containing protein [Methylobacterium sp. BE186]MDR7037570.1 hypothetical protein [Methylobacterium sp. BE186]
MPLTVTVRYDPEEPVWYVHDSEVPGLHAEAQTLDALVGVIGDLVPDLAAVNLPQENAGGGREIAVCIQHLMSAKPAHAC